jgi:hypothetical protein
MKKKISKKVEASKPDHKLNLANDEPLKLDISFDQFIKKAVSTPIKNSKINKK